VSSTKVWSQTQPFLGRVSPSTLYLVSFSMWPMTSVARMNKYGTNRQPCLIDLDNLKSPPDSMFCLDGGGG
jgi:hypothetical protein